MSLNNLIISQLTDVAGSAFDLDIAVEKQKNKLITEVSNTIQEKIPIPIPINIKDVFSGKTLLPENLLTPEYINQAALAAGIGLPPLTTLPSTLKDPINNTLNSVENTVNIITQVTNTIQNSLILLQTPINTLDKLSSSLGNTVTGLNVAINTIKLIPFPTSVPPGIGIPANVLTALSDSLDKLGDILKTIDGPLSIISNVIEQINNILNPIIEKINELIKLLQIPLDVITFIRMLINFGSDITQEQIDSSIQNSISNSIKLLDTSPLLISSTPTEVSFPITYKNFNLVLENNSENPYKFPQRRIKGTNIENNQIIYNTEDGMYSFSSSTQVLFNEIKFRIDSLESV